MVVPKKREIFDHLPRYKSQDSLRTPLDSDLPTLDSVLTLEASAEQLFHLAEYLHSIPSPVKSDTEEKKHRKKKTVKKGSNVTVDGEIVGESEKKVKKRFLKSSLRTKMKRMSVQHLYQRIWLQLRKNESLS